MHEAARLTTIALMFLAGPAQADEVVFRLINYSEDVAHGKYRSCSIIINTTLTDTTRENCRRSQDFQLKTTIKYAYAKSLTAVASVEGVSFCDAKPVLFNVPRWDLRPMAKPEWRLDQSNREAPDQATASAIFGSEDLGMTIHVTRDDSASFTFELSSTPQPMINKPLLTAARAGHDHCIAALALEK